MSGVLLDVNYRMLGLANQSQIVGWPRPTPDQPLWAYQRIASRMGEFAQAGFSGIKLPPSTRGGAGVFSAGYDKYDDYGIDGTAYGNAEMLRQCAAAAHAHGMDLWGDLVLHQYGGGRNGTYPTRRFPKTPTCFASDTTPGGVAADPVPDQQGNFGFGDRAAYLHSTPKGYMHDGAIAATQWLRDTVDFDAFRLDDVKGTYAPLVYDLLHAPGLDHVAATGEYFEGSNDPLANWVWGYMRGRASVYDFGLKFNVRDICDNASNSWMGRLADIGYCMRDAYHAVTFVESADTDNSPGQQTIWNKILGYAIMLTFPGQPQVYYRDWADDPGCYGLRKPINNLIWIHDNLAQGEFVTRTDHGDFQVFAHERMGFGDAPGCVCFFNNDEWWPQTRTVQTNFGPNQRVHEFTGNGSYNDIWTDASGSLTVTIPRNVNGKSYLVYARPMGDRPRTWKPRTTRQLFEGAPDLGTAPTGTSAINGTLIVGRVDVHKAAPIDISLTLDMTGWTGDGSVIVSVADEHAEIGRFATIVKSGTMKVQCHTAVAGWHTISLIGSGLPAAGLPFKLWVEYLAPQEATV